MIDTNQLPPPSTPQPAQATQAEVTDEQIAACVKRASTYGLPFVGLLNPGGTPSDFSKRFTAEILAMRPVQVPMMQWQPIDTAPSGVPFLAVLDCGGDQTICTMRRAVADAKNGRPDGEFVRERVTHWMPLPPPPKSHHGITAQAKKEGV